MKVLGMIVTGLAAIGLFALAWLSAFVNWPSAFPDPSVGAMMSWMTLFTIGFVGFMLMEFGGRDGR